MEVGAPFSRAQVAGNRGGGHGLDESSLRRWYHCQLNLPSPTQLPYRHSLMHKRCFFCVVPTMEQVLDPAHGKEARG